MIKFRIPEIVLGALLTVAIFAAGMTFVSSLPPQQHSEQGDLEHAADKKAEEISTTNKADERLARYTLWLMIFTGVLAVSTIGLWAVTYSTLAHARETSGRQLRAYVGVHVCNIKNFGIGTPISARLAIKNSGQTPAYGLHIMAAIEPGDVPRTNFPEPELGEPIKSTMSAGEFMTVFPAGDNPFILTANQVAKVKADAAAIWVWGNIFYKDVFGKNRRTRFRLIYSGKLETDPPGGMRFAEEGNESD